MIAHEFFIFATILIGIAALCYRFLPRYQPRNFDYLVEDIKKKTQTRRASYDEETETTITNLQVITSGDTQYAAAILTEIYRELRKQKRP